MEVRMIKEISWDDKDRKVKRQKQRGKKTRTEKWKNKNREVKGQGQRSVRTWTEE